MIASPLASLQTVPIVVGVTGHRDVPPSYRGRLETETARLLQELRNSCPSSDLVLLSSVAEGGDQIAARVALDLGIAMVVPLPFARAEYARDFDSADSRSEFERLLGRARHLIEIPLDATVTDDSVRKGGGDRTLQYARAGAFVARHAHVLLALWDGRDDSETARVVRWHLHGLADAPLPTRTSHLDARETEGLVLHVVTPRSTGSVPADACQVRVVTAAPVPGPRQLGVEVERRFARLDAFNRDWSRFASRLSDSAADGRADLGDAPDPAIVARTATTVDWYGRADALARHFQSKLLGGRMRPGIIRWLFVLVFVGVVAFEVYAHVVPAEPRVLLLYPVLLGLAGAVYVWARRRDWERKYLDYRALAEGLRVQFYWQVAGLAEPVSDHYLRMHRTEMDWIRMALLPLGLTMQARPDVEPGPREMRLVLDRWLVAQRDFLASRATSNEIATARGEWLVSVLFFLSVAIALVTAVAQLVTPLPASTTHLLIVSCALALVAAALLHGYGEKRAFSIQSKRYRWMGQLYERGQDRLESLIASGSLREAQELIEQLGEEALAENANWLLLQRQRPLEVPKA